MRMDKIGGVIILIKIFSGLLALECSLKENTCHSCSMSESLRLKLHVQIHSFKVEPIRTNLKKIE